MKSPNRFRLFLVGSALMASLGASAQQNLTYTLNEKWSNFPVGSSVIASGTDNYRYLSPGNSKNSAIVREAGGSKFLTVTTYGFASNNYSRVAWNGVTIPAPLSITDTQNNLYSVDIRYNSVNGTRETQNHASMQWSFRNAADTGFSIWAGFNSSSQLFINLGNNSNNRVVFENSDSYTIDPAAWYRFSISLAPSEGLISYEVSQILANGTAQVIWSGDTSGDNFTKMYFDKLVQAEIQVGRPGLDVDATNSSDFNNLVIASGVIPEASTVAALMGLGALGMVAACRRLRRR